MIGFGIFREADESKMIPNILTKATLRMELPLTEELVCGGISDVQLWPFYVWHDIQIEALLSS